MAGTPGRVVDFSMAANGKAHVAVGRVEIAGLPELLALLAQPLEDRQAMLAAQADDPLVVWFASLSAEERREFVRVAASALSGSDES